MDNLIDINVFQAFNIWIQIGLFIVASLAVMITHRCIYFEEKVSCEGLLRREIKSFETLIYLDDSVFTWLSFTRFKILIQLFVTKTCTDSYTYILRLYHIFHTNRNFLNLIYIQLSDPGWSYYARSKWWTTGYLEAK